MSNLNSNRRRTYGGLAPGEADFTITLARNVSDPSQIVSIDGDGMEGFLKRFRRCLMKSTSDFHANICYLRDDNSNYLYDGSSAALTGGQGDVMVYFPEFWYKGETDSSSHKIHISTRELSGYYHAPASLVGAYKAGIRSDKSSLQSVSGDEITINISMNGAYKGSRLRGKGFHLIDYMQHRTIVLMFYTRYKNTNSQAICGTGSGSIYRSGTTDSLGLTDTTASTASSNSITLVNFLGIEGCWGNVYEIIEGIHSKGGGDNAVIAYDKPDLINDDIGNFEFDEPYSFLQSNFNLPTLRKLNTSGIYGYIGDIWGGDYGDMTITDSNGGSQSYYCGYGDVSPSKTCIFYRSGYYINPFCDVLTLYGSKNSSNSDSVTGSRLAFDGTIVETSVSDFKDITSWR